MGSYVPTTAAEREQMLSKIGVGSLDDLYAAVPQEMLLRDGLDLPAGLSELEVREKVTGLAEKNKVFKTVLRGAGSYRHFIPAVVKSITSREELVTCYTPYQAEISQGVLQGTFEFQTMICELTGMMWRTPRTMTARPPPLRPSPCARTAGTPSLTSPRPRTHRSSRS